MSLRSRKSSQRQVDTFSYYGPSCIHQCWALSMKWISSSTSLPHIVSVQGTFGLTPASRVKFHLVIVPAHSDTNGLQHFAHTFLQENRLVLSVYTEQIYILVVLYPLFTQAGQAIAQSALGRRFYSTVDNSERSEAIPAFN